MDLITRHVYKPERLLYYIPITQEEKKRFYEGEIPEAFSSYDGAFGTYDCPGLFRVKTDQGELEVFGQEFRPCDDRITYPENMASIVLKPGFMINALLTDDKYIDDSVIENCVAQLKDYRKIESANIEFTTERELSVIQIYTKNNRNRVFVQAENIPGQQFFESVIPGSERENKLYKIAYYDAITDHYNWNYIWRVIDSFGLRGIQDFVFAHFDVKDFNAINVVYGHDVANRVLSRVAEHMKKQDWIYCSARCDNDNFAVMLRDMPEEEIREKFMTFFEELSTLESDEHYRVYYRCGVVPMRNTLLLGNIVADAGKLVQRTGTKSHESEVLFYTDAMHDELDWSIKIKAYLDTAIQQNEFQIYLQPKYDIFSEELQGAEALVRWNYHGKKMLAPDRFIPIFEKGGCIEKIDDIVLKKVCECQTKWEKEGFKLLPISVNLSRKQMDNPDLINHLVEIVDSYGVDHSLIDFELTESAAYDNQEYMISVLAALKQQGFKISMDDFGTGYSSLSLLTIMPVDTLKIDKSFIDGIGTPLETDQKCAVIQHIIKMAKALNLVCLTEGAEEKVQVEKLKEYGCELVQGFYYSKPLLINEYEKRLKNNM